MHRGERRNDPRISLNKLGEYLVAKPGRRQAIVRDQKWPKPYKSANYADAERVIQDDIVSGEEGSGLLQKALQKYSTAAKDGSWKGKAADLCAQALFAYVVMDGIPVGDNVPIKANEESGRMLIGGVSVNVAPDIFLLSKDGSDAVVGGVKLYLVKTNPLNDISGAYASTILYRYLAEVASNESAVSYKNCFVADVFGGRVYQAPKSYVRNMKDVGAACTEIAALWNAL